MQLFPRSGDARAWQMKHTTTPMRSVALNLVTHEIRGKKLPVAGKNLVALGACEKLGLQLATLTGTLALRALMTRALTLAAKEVPWLSQVQLAANGSFQGLAELELRLVEKNLTEAQSCCLPSCSDCWWPSSAKP